MNFRYDINGLRALAVIAVVLFHFDSSLMPGGFAGVDVFFVISGFLMTGIVIRGFERNTFNIFKFYVARADRIIPALAVLCLVLLVFGMFYLTPLDYRELGKHILSSIGFLSNIVYWKESGYFDVSSQDKWLLHTWSLSVEWQFYIIYPLLLVAMKRFLSLQSIKKLLVLSTLLGFAFSVVATIKWTSPAYYLLPTRAWEMMFGGLAYAYPWTLNENRKRFVEYLGVILILSSYVFFAKYTPWPGCLALLPVLGTYFIIVADRQNSIITNNPISQSIGRWSYSLYLWHWPIVVFENYFSVSGWSFYGIALSFLFGFLSYRLVESKQWSIWENLKRVIKLRPVWLVTIVATLSTFVYISNGMLYYYDANFQKLVMSASNAYSDWGYPEKYEYIDGLEVRIIDNDKRKNILFMGASHAEHTYPYVSNINSDYNIYYLTTPGCFSTPSMKNPKWSCSNLQNYEKLLSKINFDKVAISFYCFDCYLSDNEIRRNSQIQTRILEFDRVLSNIKEKTKETFLILGEPKGDEFDPKLAIRHSLRPYITLKEAKQNYVTHRYALSKLTQLGGVTLIDPMSILCENNICATRDDNNRFYYQDGNHMRPWYVQNKGGYLSSIFD
ncbi:acyltransferase [Vibrio sp. JC009]|uniref:acyltransferase family protein n=1 Tax=Vibrio sp. JC009 TaxID=2912314 RepID=UPI0023B0B0E1|nr:acyltransferase family protein [Vibrio sp. JC009]WED20608.1 acyltransferase [Vibrio sp. JC009]